MAEICKAILLVFVFLTAGCIDSDSAIVRSIAESDPKVEILEREGKIEYLGVTTKDSWRRVSPHVSGLKDLKGLNISVATIRTDETAKLANLEITKLVLNGCTLTDTELVEIAKMTSLLSLVIRGSEISDKGLARLATLVNLHSLDLGGCELVTGSGFESWPNHENLDTLRLYGCGINDEGIGHCVRFRNLKTISLGETKITETGLLKLAEIRGLPNPGFPDDITPDMASRWGMMRRYNRLYMKLHGDDVSLPYRIPEDPQF